MDQLLPGPLPASTMEATSTATHAALLRRRRRGGAAFASASQDDPSSLLPSPRHEPIDPGMPSATASSPHSFRTESESDDASAADAADATGAAASSSSSSSSTSSEGRTVASTVSRFNERARAARASLSLEGPKGIINQSEEAARNKKQVAVDSWVDDEIVDKRRAITSAVMAWAAGEPVTATPHSPVMRASKSKSSLTRSNSRQPTTTNTTTTTSTSISTSTSLALSTSSSSQDDTSSATATASASVSSTSSSSSSSSSSTSSSKDKRDKAKPIGISPRKKTTSDLAPLLGSKWKRKKEETGSLPKDMRADSKRKKRATISERPSAPDIAENDVFVDEFMPLLLMYANVETSDSRSIMHTVRSYYGRDNSSDARVVAENYHLMVAMKRLLDQKFAQQQELRSSIIIQSYYRGWLVRRSLLELNDRNRRARVIAFNRTFAQIIDREKNYNNELEDIVAHFMVPLMLKSGASVPIIGKEDSALLFANIEKVVFVHRGLYTNLCRLTDRWPFVTGVGQAFLNFAPSLTVYGAYVSNFDNSRATLARLRVESHQFSAALLEFEKEHGQPLSTLLCKPVDHIAKLLPLLLRLVEYAEPNSEEHVSLAHAHGLLTEASNWITQELAKCDTTQAILNIQRRIVGGDSLNLVKDQRSLILEGEVQCQTYTQEGGSNPTKPYTLFLFSDSILVTRGKGGRKAKPTDLLRVVEHLPLDQVETLFDTVGQRIEFDPARYFCFSSRNRIYHCVAADKDTKGQWLDMIRQQIRQLTKFRVFGVKLAAILEREKRRDGIPTILVKCIEYIESLPVDLGIAAEGIFRVSANQAEVAAMRDYFNTTDPNQYELSQFKYNIHTIAGVMRLWFRNLPEPLLGFDLYEPLLAAQKSSPQDFVTKLPTLLTRISETQMNILRYLVRFLSKVASHKEHNMMGASNLAIVFGPSLLRPRIESIESSLNCPVINRAVQLIIEHLPTK